MVHNRGLFAQQVGYYAPLIVLCLVATSIVQARETVPYTIRLYSFFTPSHEVFKKEWFTASIKDDFEIIIEKYTENDRPLKLFTKEWKSLMGRKIDLILRAIEKNWNRIFIYSDVDIQFFAPIKDAVLKAMHGKDLVFQQDTPSGTVCAGFIVVRANERTRQFFNRVKQYMRAHDFSDQKSINAVLRKGKKPNPDKVAWGYLPTTFFGAGTLTGQGWWPGKVLMIPDRIRMHHANFTVGVAHKLAQLWYVRELVKKGLIGKRHSLSRRAFNSQLRILSRRSAKER